MYRPGECDQALQSGPLIVEPNGKFGMKHHTPAWPRTVLGLDGDGKLHVVEARADLYALAHFLMRGTAAGGPGLQSAMSLGYVGQAGLVVSIGGKTSRLGALDEPLASAIVIQPR